MTGAPRALGRPATWRKFRMEWRAFRQRMAAVDEELAAIRSGLAKLKAARPDRAEIDALSTQLAKLENRLQEQL